MGFIEVDEAFVDLGKRDFRFGLEESVKNL